MPTSSPTQRSLSKERPSFGASDWWRWLVLSWPLLRALPIYTACMRIFRPLPGCGPLHGRSSLEHILQPQYGLVQCAGQTLLMCIIQLEGATYIMGHGTR